MSPNLPKPAQTYVHHILIFIFVPRTAPLPRGLILQIIRQGQGRVRQSFVQVSRSNCGAQLLEEKESPNSANHTVDAAPQTATYNLQLV